MASSPSPAFGFASGTLSPQAGRGISGRHSQSPSPRLRGEGWGEGLYPFSSRNSRNTFEATIIDSRMIGTPT